MSTRLLVVDADEVVEELEGNVREATILRLVEENPCRLALTTLLWKIGSLGKVVVKLQTE